MCAVTLSTTQVEQVQTVLLLFLLQRGARDSANYYGQTVLDLIESEDMRRMVRVSSLDTIKFISRIFSYYVYLVNLIDHT